MIVFVPRSVLLSAPPRAFSIARLIPSTCRWTLWTDPDTNTVTTSPSSSWEKGNAGIMTESMINVLVCIVSEVGVTTKIKTTPHRLFYIFL